MTVSDALFWVGPILFAVLGGKVFRTIKARNISGIVIMGDVQGDVTQHQAQKPPEPPKSQALRAKARSTETEEVRRKLPALSLQSCSHMGCS